MKKKKCTAITHLPAERVAMRRWLQGLKKTDSSTLATASWEELADKVVAAGGDLKAILARAEAICCYCSWTGINPEKGRQ